MAKAKTVEVTVSVGKQTKTIEVTREIAVANPGYVVEEVQALARDVAVGYATSDENREEDAAE